MFSRVLSWILKFVSFWDNLLISLRFWLGWLDRICFSGSFELWALVEGM